MTTKEEKLVLAEKHLEPVLAAWDDPTDWDDLSLYGFYCLEAAVEAAALHFGMAMSKKHWEKVDVARELHRRHGLPDIKQLLADLNDARKAVAYGDVEMPDLDAQDIAVDVERYVTSVATTVAGTK